MVNAASYASALLPGGALGQGSIFSIFGTNLGPAGPGSRASRFPLDTSLAGVEVRVGTFAAFPLFVSSGQINALLPSTVPVGQALVTVQYNGVSSRASAVKIVRSSFGWFTRNSAGTGPVIAQNFVSAAEQPLNSPAAPATPGQTMILWGTGLGPITTLDNLPPPVGNLSVGAELLVGGRAVTLDYSGRSGCCAGVDQIQFRIPTDAPTGCAVPLTLRTAGGIYANLGTLAISGGGPCPDERNLPGAATRWAEISLSRLTIEGGATSDAALAVFGGGEPPARYPAPGGCTSSLGDASGDLDAGAQLTLRGPASMPALVRNSDGRYTATATGFLGPGTYTITGAGGAAVGAFTATVRGAGPLSWSASGTRAAGLMVRWTGGLDADFVLLSGPGFTCTATPAAATFTIPTEALANVPAVLRLAAGLVSRASFAAPGLEAGVLRYAQLTARDVPLGPAPLAATPLRLPDGQSVLAELAVTAAEQEFGLMQRTELAPGHGMLFLFGQPGLYPFWMYQTLLPLDIIWLDTNRRIVFLSVNTPPCLSANSAACPIYGGRQPAQYVLEIAAGEAARHGLQLGDQLDF